MSEISKSGASISNDSEDVLTATNTNNNGEEDDDDDERNQTPYIIAPIEEMAAVR
jgi:hypothetical protein